MIYTRGPADDYNKWADITGDNGWRWDSLFPLIMRVRGNESCSWTVCLTLYFSTSSGLVQSVAATSQVNGIPLHMV